MITNLQIGYGGRLGNQMFQYAMLLGVAHKTGQVVKIPKSNTETIKPDGCLDLFTGKWIPYRFDLTDCFDINIQWMNDSEKSSFGAYYKEKFFHFDEGVFSAPKFTNFDGYFQSVKYFEHMMPVIKNVFTFKSYIQEVAQAVMSSIRGGYDETVSIHVRRGDYLGIPDILPVCESEYFQESLSQFTDKNYRFAVFSDDITWCKEAFGDNESIYYSDTNSVYADMCIMSMCDNHIISNSTFSLWAALLSNNTNKKVIAPKRWFGPKLAHNDTKDLMPESWMRI